MFLMTLGSKAHVSLGLFTGTVLRLDTALTHPRAMASWSEESSVYPRSPVPSVKETA